MRRRSLRQMSCNHGVYFGDWCESCNNDKHKKRREVEYVAEQLQKPIIAMLQKQCKEMVSLDKKQEKEYKSLHKKFKHEPLFWEAYALLKDRFDKGEVK